MLETRCNILLFNMSTFADWEKGIVNRNFYVLQELLADPRVEKILAVDFLHQRKKRLFKDYFYGIFRPSYCHKIIKQNFWGRCCQVQEKLYVLNTMNHLRGQKCFQNEIHGLLDALSMRERLIVFSYNPLLADAFADFGQVLNTFDTVDNWMTHGSFRSSQAMLRENYQKIVEQADVIFTVSSSLLEFYKNFRRAQDVFWVPNGAPKIFFHPEVLRKRWKSLLEKISRPKLGYVGTITPDRVDFDLLAFLARQNSEKSFIMAGPVWKEAKVLIRKKLYDFSNIFWLGRVPVAQTPSIIADFDICLNPHLNNNFVQFTNSMKLYEYLAVGKPVVSTNLPDQKEFGNFISFASTPEAFQTAILGALRDDSSILQQARQTWALRHTYTRRVQQMLDIMFEHLK